MYDLVFSCVTAYQRFKDWLVVLINLINLAVFFLTCAKSNFVVSNSTSYESTNNVAKRVFKEDVEIYKVISVNLDELRFLYLQIIHINIIYTEFMNLWSNLIFKYVSGGNILMVISAK